jgi:predicted NBD/HSP70 family sugar kinase
LTYAAGLDVTPGTVVGAIADVTGTILALHEVSVQPTSVDPAVCVHEVLSHALEAAGLTRKSLTHVTVGSPGSIDPITGRLEYASHLRGWHEVDLPVRLRDAIGVPVEIVNDVRLAAVAEMAARGARDFALLWMGAGLGLAHVSGGQVLAGARGGAGEVGYMPVPGADVPRSVRRRNTGGFQSLVGAPAVRALLAEAGFGSRTAELALRRAASAADTGNAAARSALDHLASRVASGLAAICSVIDPPLVVLAGDVGTAGGEALRSRVQRELDEISMTRPPVETTVVAARPVLHGAVRAATARARDTAFAAFLGPIDRSSS